MPCNCFFLCRISNRISLTSRDRFEQIPTILKITFCVSRESHEKLTSNSRETHGLSRETHGRSRETHEELTRNSRVTHEELTVFKIFSENPEWDRDGKKKLIPVNNREQRLKSRIIPSGKLSNQSKKKSHSW